MSQAAIDPPTRPGVGGPSVRGGEILNRGGCHNAGESIICTGLGSLTGVGSGPLGVGIAGPRGFAALYSAE